MSSLTLGAGGISAVPPPQHILGEICSQRFPLRFEVPFATVQDALRTAGFDPAKARVLCDRSGFIRAARSLAAGRLVRNVEETQDRISFQFTREYLDAQAARLNYNFEAVCTLDKSSGSVSSTDPQIQALASQEMSRQIGVRRIGDIRRLVNRLMDDAGDNFAFSEGIRYVPEGQRPFLDQLERFTVALGGQMQRILIPAGDPATTTTVTQVIADGVSEAIDKVEQHAAYVAANMDTLTVRSANHALHELEEAEYLLHRQHQWIGANMTILEDRIALARKAVRDAQKRETPAPVTQTA